MNKESFAREINATIDAKDSEKFGRYLCEDGAFIFGNG